MVLNIEQGHVIFLGLVLAKFNLWSKGVHHNQRGVLKSSRCEVRNSSSGVSCSQSFPSSEPLFSTWCVAASIISLRLLLDRVFVDRGVTDSIQCGEFRFQYQNESEFAVRRCA